MNQTQDGNTREIEKLESANKLYEHNIRNLQTKAIQNVNLYFVFQAVILASSSSTAATCRQWWVPFSLSVIAAVTNLLGLCGSMSWVLKSRDELDQSLLDVAFMKSYRVTREELGQVQPGSPLCREGREVVRPKPCGVRRWRQCLMACLFGSLFLGFSGVVIYGCHRVLCNNPGDGNCAKLC